jgi:hypothetical protein
MIGRKRIFLLFKIFMAFVYLSLGVIILFTNMLLLPVTHLMRIMFGTLVLLYGSFRIYTVFIRAKSDETD